MKINSIWFLRIVANFSFNGRLDGEKLAPIEYSVNMNIHTAAHGMGMKGAGDLENQNLGSDAPAAPTLGNVQDDDDG